MTTQEIKTELSRTAAIFNKNLKTIRIKLSRQALLTLRAEYGTSDDHQLAKLLTIKGIQL